MPATAVPPAALAPSPPRRRSRRERLAGLERPLLLAGLGLVTLHLLELAFAGPDTTVLGVAGIVAVAALAAALQPRVTRPTRAALAIPFGLLFLGFGTVAHVLDLFTSGPRWSDVTGTGFAIGGLLLVASGVAALAAPGRPSGRPLPRRALHVVAWAAGAVATFVLVVVPVGNTILATHAARLPVDDAALKVPHRTVSIPAQDGDRLSAWYVPSRNGAAVLMAHGAGGHRGRITRQAEIVARRGYGVLVLDLPGHGESDGRSNLYGSNAQPAIDAALDWLAARPGVGDERIAGFGISLGGEVLLEAAARDDRLAAVISDGAQRPSDDRELDIIDGAQAVTMGIAAQVTRGVTGTREAPALSGLVDRIGPRPVLLIAGGVPPHEAEVNAEYARRIGPSAEQWTVPGAGHTAGVREQPAAYARNVTSFLDRAL
jgi:dienelactone hydrolase